MFPVHLETPFLNLKFEFQEAGLCRITELRHSMWPAIEPRKLESEKGVLPLSAGLCGERIVERGRPLLVS